MHLIRYADEDGTIGVGIQTDDGTIRKLPFRSMAQALRISVDQLRNIVDEASVSQPPVPGVVRLLPPLDGWTEVWGSGVTYRRSREARVEESGRADVYSSVYDADRPELFFKASSWRVTTDGDPIGIRQDSGLDVPEPELAVVANAAGEPVGYTVCDDITSRTIESQNPLYLPQAKVYAGSCAISPLIRPAWEVEDWHDLEISCVVLRAGVAVWSGATSTSAMKRTLTELLSWLYRQDAYPDGVILSTGTGLVPDLDFTLREGDLIDIAIAEVGRLRNHVAVGTSAFAWLSARVTNGNSNDAAEEVPT